MSKPSEPTRTRPAASKDFEARFQEVAKLAEALQQKGFCVMEGLIGSSLRDQAIVEASAHKATGSFKRPPREVLCGLFGEIGSAWIKEVSHPKDPVPPDEIALRSIDEYIASVGADITYFAKDYFGMPLKGRCASVVHYSRMPEDRANPPLLDPEEADLYYKRFCTKKLKVIYYLGPSTAALIIAPIGSEFEAYRAQIQPGHLIIVRCDVCRVSIEPKQSQFGVSQEIELLPQYACAVVPPPAVLNQWYRERFQAIVDNNVVDDVPEEWLHAARAQFFKNPPVRVVEIDTELPSSTLGSVPAPFEASVFGGCDCISKVPSYKWDVEAYYDEDRSNVDDFKMYTKHVGAVDVKWLTEDFNFSLFGITHEEGESVDTRHVLLAQSSIACLRKCGLRMQDTKGKDIGIYGGLSGNDMLFAYMVNGGKLGRAASTSLSNAASVNRISYMLGSTGPSVAVDTEDSSGSAAVDTAVTHIRAGKCGSQALAGGVNYIAHPISIVFLCASGLISSTCRSRVFDESSDGFIRSDGIVTMFCSKHKGGPLRRGSDYMGVITGSAVNSKGVSASLLAPSSAAIADVMTKAMKDAGGPASILSSVEVHSSGSSLADAIEFAMMRKLLVSREENLTSCMLRNVASSTGSTGPASGLVSIAMALLQIQMAAHGPCLHIRQLFQIGVSAAEDGASSRDARVQLPTEATPVSEFGCQTVGVSSFGGSGTNVHHILAGVRGETVQEKPSDNALHWFPSGIAGDATAPEVGYFILGSWNAWSEPVQMEVEEPGVYGFTITMGENLWETFLIWIDSDEEEVLHPQEHWSGKGSKVLGPEHIGRDFVWIIDARHQKVRLVNEVQKKALDEQKQMDLALGKLPDELDYRPCVMFKESAGPSEDEKLDVNSMPVIDQNKEDWGMPGDTYRVRLQTLGSFKMVTWDKCLVAEGPSFVVPSVDEHKYYLVGDHNYWSRDQEMKAENGFHTAEAHCLKDNCTFQIVRDQDWDQAFYPKYPLLTSTKSGTADQEIAGPDGSGLFKKWQLPNKAGDVYTVNFSRTLADDGMETHRSIGWEFVRNEPIDFKELAKSHKYYVISSSTDFEVLNEMEYDETDDTWAAWVELATGRKEDFIILLNQNWLAAVHPNVAKADFRDTDHKVMGPDDGGDKMFWQIGKHEEDRRVLRQGDVVKVSMHMKDGMPRLVEWQKAVAHWRGKPPASEE